MPPGPASLRLVLALAASVTIAYAAVLLAAPPGSALTEFFGLWVYLGLILLAVFVSGWRAYATARDRAAWVVLTLALAAWALAEIYYAVAAPEGYPSFADLGWIAFYPLAYIGLVLLLRPSAGSVTGTLWLDGITASLAAAALGAAVLVELVLRSAHGPASTSAVATNLAYPLGDALLFSAVVGVFSLAGWRPGRRWFVLGAGVLASAVADGVFLFQTAAGTYEDGAVIDVLWPASMLLIAWAAWIEDRDARALPLAGRPLLAVPAGGSLLAIGILVYDHFAEVNLLAVALATGTLLAVVVRLGITFRENHRLYERTRVEAVTDALTGLGNRRLLIADLEFRLARPEAEPGLLMLFDLDGFKRYNDDFGHLAGDSLLARLGAKLAAVAGSRGAAYRLGGDEFCLLAQLGPDEPAERVIEEALAALSERGEGFRIESSYGAVRLPDEAGDPSAALRLADDRLAANKRARRESADRTIHTLLEALAEREPHLQVHLDGVEALSVAIGRTLGLEERELRVLARAAELHDLGKLAIPDGILSKPGPLDEQEWEFVRQHPLVGERILRGSPALQEVASIVRSTHEHWDGSGYPDGLAGEQIPLAARIVGACDAFAAMASRRPYRTALAPEAALAELERRAGTQFDPTVVRILAALVRDYMAEVQAA